MTPSTLEDWLRWIEAQHPSEIDMELERVAAVAQRLALHFSIPIITVAGTNGKGSCVALLSAILDAAGYRCGSYTSPHLLRYNERVCVAGRAADDASLCRAFSAVESARGDLPLTYFEYGTLAALYLFQQAGLDVLILEVGLGGRLDAVNVLDPDIAIVSSVDLDHQAWLGQTREQIGREKAGIFRPGKPAIMGDPQAVASLSRHAHSIGAELRCRDRDFGFETQGDTWRWWGGDARGGRLEYRGLPKPRVMLDNAAAVLQALAFFPGRVSEQALREGLAAVALPARGERRPYRGRVLLLDVAHNPAAVRAMCARISANPRRAAVFSVLADKDLRTMVEICESRVERWHIAPLHISARAMPVADIAAAVTERGSIAQGYPDLEAALHGAVAETEEGDEILVFGSFYTVAEVLTSVTNDTLKRGQQL